MVAEQKTINLDNFFSNVIKQLPLLQLVIGIGLVEEWLNTQQYPWITLVEERPRTQQKIIWSEITARMAKDATITLDNTSARMTDARMN
jgi:hypothetical protein